MVTINGNACRNQLESWEKKIWIWIFYLCWPVEFICSNMWLINLVCLSRVRGSSGKNKSHHNYGDDLCKFSHLGRGLFLSVWREEATPWISCRELQSLKKKNVKMSSALPASYQGGGWFNMIWIDVYCVLTFQRAPASEDGEGDEEVVGEVVHAGDHHTWSTW